METWLTQDDADLRLLWGVAGATALVRRESRRPAGDGEVEVAVVIDVLSFTTTLSVALDRSIDVRPVPRLDASAHRPADPEGTVLAQPRRSADDPSTEAATVAGPLTLSPADVRAGAWAPRLVLPSPNGATVSHLLTASRACVVGACLRNAGAVAHWIRSQHPQAPVTVVAAGERWPDGTLRPAVEDLWGAGAVLAALGADRGLEASPEARAAVAAYQHVRSDLETHLRSSTSGRELWARGYGEDVVIAAETDASTVVPVLRGDVFGRA